MPSVFEEGNPRSKICFLAEAPAKIEMKMDRLLTGPSGKLFNHLLHESGLVRAEAYLLNVWPFMVYKQDKGSSVYIYDQYDDLLWSNRRGFTEKGLEEAWPTVQLLERSGANCIVPLGGVALSLLFGDSRIGKWRGSILTANSSYVQGTRLVGRKVVGTYHPAFVIRGQYLATYAIIHDMKRAKEESRSPTVALPRRELIIDPSYPEVMAFQRDMMRARRVGHDIEVLNSQISCMCYSPEPDMSMCVPILDRSGRQNRWNEEQETEIWLNHQKIMKNPKIQKINHAILFDTSFEFEQNNITTSLENADCSMTAWRVVNTDFPKGLDYVCSILTREPYYKDDGKIWKKPWVDIERFWRYNALDGAIAVECWDEMQEELQDPDWRHTYQMHKDLFPVLTYMMVHGMRVNRARLQKVKEDVSAKITEHQGELDAIAGYPLNTSSPKQMIAYFYGEKGIKPYVSRKTGRPTCDDKALAAIFKRYRLPEAKLSQEIRTHRTLLQNFLEIQFDPDDMLRCSIDATGARTGRLSTSETVRGTGHNMQNIPPSFRGFLEAEQ
jgi:uracil-DNA glycosylase